MRVVVVGGGIVGASAAYHLAKEGVEVVLVDRADDGQATAAGAGIVSPWPAPGAHPAMAALGIAAAEHYPRLVEELVAAEVGDPGYARVGSVLVMDDGPLVSAVYEGMLGLRRHPGTAGLGEIELLGPGVPAERLPLLRSDLAGVAAEGTCRVDGRAFRDALLQAASLRGVDARTGAAELMLSRRTVTGVRLDGETIGADAVVVAAGAWSSGLCLPLGVELPVFPQRGQILHIGLSAEDSGAWPAVLTLDEHYLLPFPAGRVVAGATRESDSGFEHRVTVGGLHKVLTDALSIAPGLAAGTVAEVRVGFRPLSPDGMPSLGVIDGIDGLIIATGLGPIGLTYGPYLGAVAADLARGRGADIDITALRPDRPLGGAIGR